LFFFTFPSDQQFSVLVHFLLVLIPAWWTKLLQSHVKYLQITQCQKHTNKTGQQTANFPYKTPSMQQNRQHYVPAVSNDGFCQAALLCVQVLHSNHKLHQLAWRLWNPTAHINNIL